MRWRVEKGGVLVWTPSQGVRLSLSLLSPSGTILFLELILRHWTGMLPRTVFAAIFLASVAAVIWTSSSTRLVFVRWDYGVFTLSWVIVVVLVSEFFLVVFLSLLDNTPE